MMADIWYNDNDDYCCRVLRRRISDGWLPKGVVDDRDIREVEASELSKFNQWHLFAGIGGFPLGLTWAGLPPDTRILTGGFPCQDISTAGKGAGLSGKRSGLWSQMRRFIGVLRPDIVFVENVAALLKRGLGTVLGELAEIGYDCKWHCVPAAYVGAPHRRDRIWIVGVRDVADSADERLQGHAEQQTESADASSRCSKSEDMADAEGQGLEGAAGASLQGNILRPSSGDQDVANTKLGRCGQKREQSGLDKISRSGAYAKLPPKKSSTDVADANWADGEAGHEPPEPSEVWRRRFRIEDQEGDWWAVEPDVGRVAHGIPARVDRLKCLGNAVVPQVVQFVAQMLIDECNGH